MMTTITTAMNDDGGDNDGHDDEKEGKEDSDKRECDNDDNECYDLNIVKHALWLF